MRLPCPFCGDRDVQEFACRGEAPGPRPNPAAPDAMATFTDWVYSRANPCGPTTEHWYHASGCRRWLAIKRDVRTHIVLSSVLVDGDAP